LRLDQAALDREQPDLLGSEWRDVGRRCGVAARAFLRVGLDLEPALGLRLGIWLPPARALPDEDPFVVEQVPQSPVTCADEVCDRVDEVDALAIEERVERLDLLPRGL